MKIDLSQPLTNYSGQKIIDAETNAELTMRQLLRMYAGSYMPPSAEAAVIANAVGLKIHQANGAVELTDEEYKVLKSCIEQPRHPAMIYSQIYQAVNPGGEADENT